MFYESSGLEGQSLELDDVWVELSPKRPTHAHWEPHNVTLFHVRAFAEVMKVRTSRCGHPGLGWALRPLR